MKIKYLVILLVLLSVLSCSGGKKNINRPIRIGFSTSSEIFLQERWKRDITIFTSMAKELGAEVIFSKSSKNSSDQISEINYLLKQDIDVLMVIPRDRDNLVDVLKKVNDKGIPIISYDRLIMGVPLAGYISFDNQEVGHYLSKSLLTSVPIGNYVIINGSVHDNNSYEVNIGIHKILDPHILKGDIQIVEEIWLEDWSYDEAFYRLNELFENGAKVDAISGANDMMAQAAIKVLAERRLAGKVAVVGQDADLAACQSIIRGTQLMTVYKPIQKLAFRAAQIAVLFAKGKNPDPDLYINNYSSKSIPYFIERPIPVNRDNMDITIIKDGFHSKKDIYSTL